MVRWPRVEGLQGQAAGTIGLHRARSAKTRCEEQYWKGSAWD
jgi:hypothetical protein